MPGDPFYSTPAWKALRREALRRDGHCCVICRKDVSGWKQSRVDHIKPRKTHPHLALDLANTRTLCTQHDNQSHSEKWRGGDARVERFKGCDAQGWPLDPARRGIT
jgi:5-methylcytosine-specific restriction endonuclease McrA